MNYADIILPLPIEGTFTYTVPAALQAQVGVGMRAIVAVGRSKRYVGIVARLHDDKPSFPCKDILRLADSAPVVLPTQLRLWQWVADYYLSPLGDVYKAAVPAPLRSVERTRPKLEKWVTLGAAVSDEASLHRALDSLGKAPARRRLLETFIFLTHLTPDDLPAQGDLLSSRRARSAPALPREVLLNEAKSTTAILNALVKQQILAVEEREEDATLPHSASSQATSPPFPPPLSPLSPAQQAAVEDIRRQFREKRVVLLRGVTSSGKTEIYIHLIAEALRRGEQVLYLLPEIALTVQITERLRRVFGDAMCVYHSRYTDRERMEIWQRQLSDRPYRVVVGARSAVFLPFQRLGLTVIDEEHDPNFKQSEPAPRYHARSVAIMMGTSAVLLGSATPCAESWHNARRGKFGLVELLSRYNDQPLPKVEVVDTKDLYHRKMMRGMLSPTLIEAMQEVLSRGRQVILFHNRRGYSPIVECSQCGWTPRCSRCDVPLVLHRQTNSLTCHTCGALYAIPRQCPQCQSTQLRTRGYGTEKVEDTVVRLFPQARIARMDLDNTRTRHGHETIIQQFARREADILVGTQMVTKGLDFSSVDLVAILDADQMLNNPDFRSSEAAFAMMTQVSGRAGRREGLGRVVLQTRQAASPVVEQVMKGSYTGFMDDLLAERKAFRYPPFTHLIYIYLRHTDEQLTDSAAQLLAGWLAEPLPRHVMGPDKPSVGRIRQLHIRKIVIKADGTPPLTSIRNILRHAHARLLKDPRYRSVQLYCDIDP